MRILIFTQYFYPEVGAAQTRLSAMASELLRMGFEIEIVTAMPNYSCNTIFPEYRNKIYIKDKWKNCDVHRFWIYAAQGKGFRRIFNYLSFTLITCFGIFKAKKPDWIFVNSGPLFLSIPAFVASRIWGIPFIFNVSDLWAKSVDHFGIFRNRIFLLLLKKFELWSYANADVVTVVTEGIKKVLIEEDKISRNKICFLPNGVDPGIFYPRLPNKEILNKYNLHNKEIFIYPGTHGYAHALEMVLETAKLLKENKKIHFLFIGGGSEKQKLIKKKNSENINNVTFIDPVPQEELAEFLSVATCGLIHQKNTPLANETRPAKTYPIMAMGKPLIFAGFGEGAKIINQAQAGIIIPSEKPEILKETILSIIEDKDKLKQMGVNALKYVLKNFTWKVLVENWIYELMPLKNPKLKKPLVSIVTPTYNSKKFIRETISSVKQQTYLNWEMIIVDDGSKDNTYDIIKEEAKEDGRIKIIKFNENKGVAIARNEAIRYARGEFLSFLDSDDFWLEDKLEFQLNYMIRGNYAFTYSRFRRISENGKKIGRILSIPIENSYHKLLMHNTIGTLTVMLNKKKIGNIEMVNEHVEDFILWLNLLKKGYSSFGIQKDLARYRFVGVSVSHNKLRAACWVWNIYRNVEKISFFKSIWLFLNYSIRVSYKYSRF